MTYMSIKLDTFSLDFKPVPHIPNVSVAEGGRVIKAFARHIEFPNGYIV